MRRSVSSLISGLTVSMERIAEGVFDLDIPGFERSDDIGRMARRVAQFRDDAVEKRALEARAETDRVAADTERGAREAEREAAAREQNVVVDAIATGLTKLSAGELMYRITKPFSSDYERLRNDFNSAMQTLQETIQVIVGSAQGLRSGAGEITQASDDLSRRTEQQAATLEQTAAALDEITATVRKTADGASNARNVVETAKTDAERSGEVVRATVEAMSGIEESSRQISNIISVIDEIAFQTNLLALNAGVEAARAGDSGRGFAVVATEVRALAQRSADAAKEIKGLISASGRQVDNGVKLVAETGQALTRIVAQVSQLNHLVTDIAASAVEQSTGLHEVNIAMHQMDQVTQQNAAMVEETTAAAYNLSRETTQLTGLVSRFQTNAGQVRESARQRVLVEA
jgi:methyl-accepting chemotaxis protein